MELGVVHTNLPSPRKHLPEARGSKLQAEWGRREEGGCGEEVSELSRSEFKDRMEKSNRAADSSTECLGFFHTVEHATK